MKWLKPLNILCQILIEQRCTAIVAVDRLVGARIWLFDNKYDLLAASLLILMKMVMVTN
ncbi:MAG: hypothetical protein ACLRXQ_11630 [Phascolarctobacterium faecium]